MATLRGMTAHPPLTRGKHTLDTNQTSNQRLIPAHAGKTQPPIPGSAANPAHPRSRGENITSRAGISLSLGSSPLTRGKPPGALGVWGDSRLIPAHAGKTRLTRSWACSLTAHPRSRGENAIRNDNTPSEWGSSPLTRGKLTPSLPDPLDRGLIPAHAGKTPPERGRRGLQTAHPRSRGENRLATGSVGRASGSSPLTRGKLFYESFTRIL